MKHGLFAVPGWLDFVVAKRGVLKKNCTEWYLSNVALFE